MKLLFLASLLSFSAMAADYNCRTGMVKLALKTNGDMSSLVVRDAQTGEFYYNGIVSEVIHGNDRTELMFETRSHNFLQLQFITSELEKESERIFGFARGWYGTGFLDGSIQCFKKATLGSI